MLLTEREAQLERMLRNILFYATDVYEDKPHQFWNQLRIAANLMEDEGAALLMGEYVNNGCAIHKELKMLRNRT